MYLLASKQGVLTGRRLAKNLNLKFSTDVANIEENSEIVIRYGNAQLSDRTSKDTDCNSRDSILRMSAKHKLWTYLEDTDILSPIYYKVTEIPDDLNFPCFSRERLHRLGKDIIVINDPREITVDAEYIVPFYPTLREYRVHVVYGKVVKVLRKYPIGDFANDMIRTSAFGWQYKLSNLKQIMCVKSMIETAKETAKILDANFCGIDMAWSAKDNGLNRWIVWEVNSAPSLNSSSLKLYTEILKEHLAERLQFSDIHKSDENNG